MRRIAEFEALKRLSGIELRITDRAARCCCNLEDRADWASKPKSEDGVTECVAQISFPTRTTLLQAFY